MYFVKNQKATLKCIIAAFFIILTISSGCKKSDSQNAGNGGNAFVNPPDDFTTVPPAATVHTTISVYIPSSNAGNGSVEIEYYIVNYNKDKGGFSQQGNFDKYNTYIAASGAMRFVPITNSIRNYVDVGNQPGFSVNSISTGNGSGYFNLPNGAKLIYPSHAFGISYGDQSAKLNGGIISPTSTNPVISYPTVTVDLNEQRWFLRYFSCLSVYLEPALIAGKLIDLEYPIPINLQVNAPDSLEAWHLETGDKWVKRGIAKKSGNIYKFTFSDDGHWCFGIREKGTYKEIQVRTSDGIPVINAIVQIKDDISDVAAARTDANGNAICFVPLNRQFTITIPPSWENPNSPYPLVASAGPFTNSGNTPYVINYPASTNRVRVIKGKVTKCDGKAVENATITVIEPVSGKTYCHMPVVNGQYSGAIVGDIYNNITYALKLQDNTTGQVGNDTTIKWQAGDIKDVDLSLCKAPTALFMDYTLDGVSYPIKGDTLNFDAGAQKITASQGKNSLEFNYPSGYQWPGSNNIIFTSLVFNHVAADKKGIGTLTITRYDAASGGLVEGYFIFTYTDLLYIDHEIRGIFRLKKTT